jgi:hypothetical protein
MWSLIDKNLKQQMQAININEKNRKYLLLFCRCLLLMADIINKSHDSIPYSCIYLP